MDEHSFWSGKRVVVTGHTGFKGGWLTLWLRQLGAQVTGIALAPTTQPNLFDIAGIGHACDSRLIDIRNADLLAAALRAAQPEIVFHLAAQPLVRASYADGVGTWMTNAMGTVFLLDALRGIAPLRAVVVVTSDKCYENYDDAKVGRRAFSEGDPLGGHDPYSSSKAAAELVAASWRRSFFAERGVGIATARAGNVIGGGDWAEDRLIPDLVRGASRGVPVAIRHPEAVRPWQHVLDALNGYVLLAERAASAPSDFSCAWNFGPDASALLTVGDVAERVAAQLGGNASWEHLADASRHEAAWLALDSTLAHERLGWMPRMSADQAIEATTDWYRAFRTGHDMNEFSLQQLAHYEEAVA